MGKKIITTAAILAVFLLDIGSFQDAFAAEKKIKIRIPQCVCDETDSTVRFVLGSIKGIKSFESNPVNQSATIVFDDTETSFEQIRDALRGRSVTVLGKPDYLN